MKVEVKLQIEVPEDGSVDLNDENAVKDWIMANHSADIRNSLEVSSMTHNNTAAESAAATTVEPQQRNQQLEFITQRLNLLDKIAQVQRQFLQSEGPKVVFGCLLEGLLQLMNSEYGFIGEVKHDESTMYLQTHAITNIAWDAATRAFFKDNVDSGLKFTNLNSLFGTVMTTKQPVISNTPRQDSRACGVPKGHPPLNHFLGIPFFKKGGEMNGMVGIANKPGGYSEKDIEFLEPFTVTCSNLIQAYWQIEQNQHLINTLEEKVRERTKELELANHNLEEANRRVVRASAAQLEHFACMSHEIRTPLNCVIGLSSLLQETKLEPSQEEMLRMIVSSGDLLLAVVNDVLDYSKLETGNVEIEIRRSNLQDTLDSIVHSIEMKSRDKNLTVRTFYDTSLPEFVHTDSRRLQQILYNLLGNAIKFSKEGGIVELGVCICDVPAIKPSVERNDDKNPVDGEEEAAAIEEEQVVSSSTNDDVESSGCPFHRDTEKQDSKGEGDTDKSRCPFLRTSKETPAHATLTPQSADSDSPISNSVHGEACPFAHPLGTVTEGGTGKVLRFVVKDYGKGISKADFEKIFKPFNQGNPDTEQLYGGTGLGLAITSKLVNALGGTVSVDSEEGEYARFTVDLPFTDEQAWSEKIPERLQNTTILLVHNDRGKIARLKAICAAYNVDIMSFANLDEMVDVIQKNGALKSDRTYICLVDENLYQPMPYQRLASMARSVLLTCGPNYSVKETNGHYRSLLRILPFVLLKSIGACLDSSAPVSSATASPRAPSKIRSDSVSFDNLRVLIAEDNLINQKVLHRMLKRVGLTKIDIVDNGQKAVDQVAKEDYDVVLMDMQMPVMGGVEACRRIVQWRGDRELPKVVFVTAHVENSFELEAARAGGSGFLPKPFNVQGISKCFKDLQLTGPPHADSTLSEAACSESNMHISHGGAEETPPSS